MDTILGNTDITVDHVPKLKYIDAVLKESLRLQPPAAQIGIGPKETGGLLAGKYPYSASDIFILDIIDLHRDPKVWGPDANAFRPERMLDGRYERLPPNSLKPFGNGVRACIGRDFAMQEAIMTIALILQRFHIEKADPSYKLVVEQTITQKPVGFFMKARRRPGKSLFTGLGAGHRVKQPPPSLSVNGAPPPYQKDAKPSVSNTAGGKSLLVLYGSNSGTCKSFAEDVAVMAPRYGFVVKDEDIRTLDSATGKLPTDRPVIIICPSYEGKPSDDSRKFVAWLETTEQDKTLARVNYTVFGVGNTDWADTYQRIPKLIDRQLAALGASRFAPLGAANMKEDVFGGFDEWSEQVWEAFPGSKAIATEDLKIEILTSDRLEIETDMGIGTVMENREIASTEVGYSKMHMEISLPEHVKYRTGNSMQHPFSKLIF